MPASLRSQSPHASAVLEHLADARRKTLQLPADKPWLSAITPHYPQLLSDMEDRRSLYRVMRGKYVVAPRGTTSVDQAASYELLTDLLLRDQGEYYVGFLTAFITYGLADLHSRTIYAAIRQDQAPDQSELPLGSGTLHLVRLSASRWPRLDAERERHRVERGLKEFVWRASLERTLVDGLLRPDMCAGIETVISGWGRASRKASTDWERVWAIARPMGTAIARRVAYMLCEIGHEHIVEPELAQLRAKTTRVMLDRSNGVKMTGQRFPRDRRTGVSLNVPKRSVRGWLTAGEIG